MQIYVDSINGKHFAMELHAVFYNDKYGSMRNATKHSDGLAVMAFFFQIDNRLNGNRQSKVYTEFSNSLDLIKKPGKKTLVQNPRRSLLDYVRLRDMQN
jgi:hypothetical protein